MATPLGRLHAVAAGACAAAARWEAEQGEDAEEAELGWRVQAAGATAAARRAHGEAEYADAEETNLDRRAGAARCADGGAEYAEGVNAERNDEDGRASDKDADGSAAEEGAGPTRAERTLRARPRRRLG